MTKILFLCAPGQETFVKPVAEHFKTLPDYQVKECYSDKKDEVIQTVSWADIVWQEWADPLCAAVTRHPTMLDNKKLIIRLHSYEVLQYVGGYIKDIDWDRCDALICVADHVRIEAVTQITKLTNLNKNFETFVIPNGVDMEKFPLTEDGWDVGVVNKVKNKGKNIAYIGSVTDKKGPMLMLHAFDKLVHGTICYSGEEGSISLRQPRPDYKLHVAGDFYDLRYLHYWEHMTKEMKLENNIVLHGRVENMPEFLKTMHYVVCSSPWESQNMSVMEAMATGCMPLVHNFPGSKNIYPEMFVWTTIDEFVDKILTMPWSPSTFRKIIQERYDFKDRIKDIEEVMKITQAPSYGESFDVKG